MKTKLLAGAAVAAAATMARAPLTREAQETPEVRAAGERQPPPARGERAAAFVADSYDSEARTVEAVFATGRAVNRRWYIEELEVSEAAVDFSRVGLNQCRLLFNHDMDQPIGTVTDCRIENGQLVGTLQFAQTEQGDLYAGMVQRGELTGISVGYSVKVWTITEDVNVNIDTWRATSWELLEVSLVTIPADPMAGVRSAEPAAPGATPEEDDMRRNHPSGGAQATDPAPSAAPAAADPAPAARAADPAPAPAPAPAADPAPAVRAVDQAPAPAPAPAAGLSAAEALSFARQARNLGVETAEITALIENPNSTRSAVTEAILMAAAERQAAATASVAAGAAARVTHDARSTHREAMESALLHRHAPTRYKLSEPGREFRSMTLLEMAREALSWIGESTRGMDRMEVAQRALMSTSDFPLILANVTNRTLRDAYHAAPRTFLTLGRRVSLTDFKAAHRLQLSEAPQLLEVGENGEFKRGALTEGDEQIKLKTYGRVIGITRQVIINDDIGAFTRIPQLWGTAVATLESDIIWQMILSNPALLTDGVTVFHANHNNLKATGGSAPSATSVAAGRTAMAKQKGLDGKTVLNLSPASIVAPPELELSVAQLIGTIQPTQTSQVVPDSIRNLKPVTEARLSTGVTLGKTTTAGSATAWYLFANPDFVDTFEYAYLDGQDGPYTETRMGFDVDGVEFKARHDFGGAWLDFRGVYKDGGA